MTAAAATTERGKTLEGRDAAASLADAGDPVGGAVAPYKADAQPSAHEASRRAPLAAAQWLAGLWAAVAMVGVTTAFLPYWSATNAGSDAFLGLASLPVPAALWAARRRMPVWAVHAALMVGIAVISVSVWGSGPNASSLESAVFYTFAAIHVAVFFSRRQLAGYLALIAVSYLGALALNWRAEMASQWLVTMVLIAAPALTIAQLYARIHDLARRDALTGVVNRRMLDETLPARVDLAARDGHPLVVVAIDLDGLKVVNDRGGHAAGDRMLIHAADAWRGHLRASDLLARTGGDEFVLVLSDTDQAEAARLIERLRVSAPHVAFSAGLARWRVDESVDDLLRRADRALYRAKDAGRGRTIWAQRTEPDRRVAS